VEVDEVVQRPVETRITLTGTAQPHRAVTVASRVEEMVVQALVEEGDRVAKGQILVRLEGGRLKLQLAEAKGAAREAEALLAQQKRELARQKSLYKSKSVALRSLEDAQTSVERQAAVLDRARDRVRILEGDLADTRIIAPLAGVVVTRHVDQGEWVKQGGPVLELSVLDPLKAVIPVPERYLVHLKPGDKVEVTADALPGRAYEGRIQAIIPQGDQRSRTFPVQVRIDNPRGELKPGMLTRATFSVGVKHQALLVPKDALVLGPAGQSLFAVRGGKALPVPVRSVAAHGELMEVEGDLAPGLTIVVRGNERLRPGQTVKIRGGRPPAKAGPAGGTFPKDPSEDKR
jgi:RND family efflux transporter MFP subunit